MANIYASMNPDQLLDQARQCIEVMASDCDFHTKYNSWCNLFVALAYMVHKLTAIARENFNDGNWNPPPPELTVIEGEKD